MSEMSDEDRQLRREQYTELWKNVPVNDTAIDIPPGTTEEAATLERVLPENLSDEEINRILSETTQTDE